MNDLLISQTDGRPMYLQIMEQIKQKIAVGDWTPGTEIPSIRQLAVDLRVSVITVKRAYSELEREGIIIVQQGRPSTVAANVKLDRRLYEAELRGHLEEAVRLAIRLGLTSDQLLAQLQHWAQIMPQEQQR